MKRMTVLLLLCCLMFCSCQNDPHFTPTRWVSDPDQRWEVVDDLLARYELVGMTEQEVTDLLGQHDNYGGYFMQDNRFVYRLGIRDDFFSIDNSWLLLDFENGVVTNYTVTTD